MLITYHNNNIKCNLFKLFFKFMDSCRTFSTCFFFRFCFLFLFFLRRGEQTCHSVIQLSPVFTSLIQNSGIASFKVLHLNALAILKCLSERYLEPCQTSMRELFQKQLTIKSHWLFLQKKLHHRCLFEMDPTNSFA